MGHQILTPQEMKEAEEQAERRFHVPSLTLMERAGGAVARAILRRYTKGHVAVICGPGNNGGDGYAVARKLAAKRWPVSVFVTDEPTTPSAIAMAKKWTGRVQPFAAIGEAFLAKRPPVLIVDAIFGLGLSRSFPAAWASAIAAAKVPVVAVDIPSGVEGGTGRVLGAAIKADLTVTFFRKKPAHVLAPGKFMCGETEVAEIGIPDAALNEVKPQAVENTAPVLPLLLPETHKYARGSAVVLSGPEFSTGAARLCALAAAKIGAGVVSIAGAPEALRIHAAHVSSIMLKPVESAKELAALLSDKRINALCLGPGAGITHELPRMVMAALQAGATLVLDGDVFSVFASEPEKLFSAIKARANRNVVMTPHEGEFHRLFRGLPLAGEGKIETARRAAQLSGAVVVYKGPDTVIAAPDGRAVVNTNAPPSLATAGSGDVLAGIITGLMAQGFGAFEAACAGAYLHGAAANNIVRRTHMAEDLIAAL